MASSHDHHHHNHASEPDCEQALAEIYTYLDGELTEEKRTQIAAHLEGCNPCVEVYDFEAELRMVVSRRCHEEVPDTLRVRIAEKLRILSIESSDGADDGPAGSDPTGDPAAF